jgi:hypothetical protein
MLTTRSASGNATAVYSGRARVGYLVPSGNGLEYLWELTMTSEQMRGHPRGRSPTRELALADLELVFAAWCRAANLRKAE